jgi:hypothetical protein
MTLDSPVAAATSLPDQGRAPRRGATRIATHTVMSVVKTRDVVATAAPTLPIVVTATLETLRTVARAMLIPRLSV